MKRILLTFLLLNTSLMVAQEWHTDFEAAKKQAQTESKPIILVFQGSDWCAPCIKLDRKIWQNEAFQNHAKKHYVMVKADFPRKDKNQLEILQRKANEALANKFNPKGHFPFVVVINANEKVLGTTGYKKVTPEEYIQILDGFVSKS